MANNCLPAVLVAMKGARNASQAATLGIAVHEEAARKHAALEELARHYYQQSSVALTKLAAKLTDNPFEKSIARVKLADLRSRMDKFAADFSATCDNGGLALLRRTYERAIESGHVATNVPAALKRVQPRKIEHDLPTTKDFARIAADIFDQKKRHSNATAVEVEFLTSTELRISAPQKIRFRNIRPEWLITATAKNEDLRQVPPIVAALDLLNSLKSAEVPSGPNDPVLLVKSPRIALGNSCERPTCARISTAKSSGAPPWPVYSPTKTQFSASSRPS